MVCPTDNNLVTGRSIYQPPCAVDFGVSRQHPTLLFLFFASSKVQGQVHPFKNTQQLQQIEYQILPTPFA